MTHKLRIRGIDYQAPRFVHRRMSRNAWAIALPGYEQLFADADYGGTGAALRAAAAVVEQAVELDIGALMPGCTIEVNVTKYRDVFTVRSTIFSSAFVTRVAMEAPVADHALAEQLYNSDCAVLLNSAEALQLLGHKGVGLFVAQWLKAMRNHVYVNNITHVNLAATPEPTRAPRPTKPPVHREFWWHEH